MPNTWTIDGDPTPEQLEEIASLLLAGGVVLMPTDTIYGLHAMATDERALARIAAMKERDAEKRFIVLAADAAQVERLGCVVPAVLHDIWPGPLTAVLPQGGTTVAARVPDVAWLRKLLERTGPLASTSANRSGEPPITEPKHLARDLQDALDGLVDGGPRNGEPSTIVDFTADEPRFIREAHNPFTQKLRKTLRKTL